MLRGLSDIQSPPLAPIEPEPPAARRVVVRDFADQLQIQMALIGYVEFNRHTLKQIEKLDGAYPDLVRHCQTSIQRCEALYAELQRGG